jgi:hypothetical protein
MYFVDEAIRMSCNNLFNNLLSKTGLLRDARKDDTLRVRNLYPESPWLKITWLYITASYPLPPDEPAYRHLLMRFLCQYHINCLHDH